MTTKICTLCGEAKTLDQYYRWKDKNQGTVRPQSRCKKCQKAEARKAYKLNPGKWNRDGHLQARYGITVADYEDMLAAQGGVCWICQSPPKKRRLAVDHCHKSGKIRGLLCWNCNYRLLPAAKDSVKVLQRAADYLNKTN